VTSEFIRRRETKSADRAILYCLPSLLKNNLEMSGKQAP